MKCYFVLNALENNHIAAIEEFKGFYESIKDDFEKVVLLMVERDQNPECVVGELAKLNLIESCVFFNSSPVSKEIATRLSVRLGGSLLLELEKVDISEEEIIAGKRIYAGNLMAEYRIEKRPFFGVLAKGKIPRIKASEEDDFEKKVQIEKIVINEPTAEKIVILSETKREESCELSKAKRLLVIGNGVKKKEDVERFQEIANKMYAEIAGTRPVIMQGLLPKERLIGVSGIIANPEICITVGVAGMAGFYAGIENCPNIIAVNSDKDALMVHNANQVLIEDWKKVEWPN